MPFIPAMQEVIGRKIHSLSPALRQNRRPYLKKLKKSKKGLEA
jgi:hypothetical protein